MVDVARYFLSLPGRVLRQVHALRRDQAMLDILTRSPKARDEEDLSLLQEMPPVKDRRSAAGQEAPNRADDHAVFPKQYETHIRDKKCPAHVCRQLKRLHHR